MKRFKKFMIALVVSLFLLPTICFAANSSVTVSVYAHSSNWDFLVIKLACIGDDGSGAVAAETIAISEVKSVEAYTDAGYYFYELWTVAGTGTAPDAADIVVTDELAATLFTETSVLAASGTTEGTVTKYRQVNSPLVVTQSNQDTASATWDVYIKLVK